MWKVSEVATKVVTEKNVKNRIRVPCLEPFALAPLCCKADFGGLLLVG